MAHVPPQHSGRLTVSPPAELSEAPRAVVHFGNAPDGLPWLVDADRSQRLQRLLDTVLSVFELSDPDELPERVRLAVENDVAAGLMGVHDADLDGRGARAAYVSRRKIKHLLGPSVLSQIIEGSAPPLPGGAPEPEMHDRAAITNVGALAVGEQDEQMVEAVERSIDERRAKRHLLIALSGEHGRAFSASGETWRVRLGDREAYAGALTRVQQNHYGGDVAFEVPRRSLVRALVAVARDVAKLHARGLVHGDLAPGNVLLGADGPISFDSLDVKAGTPATAATFEWAAPEQIVGQPIDPRTDVFALGKMVAALVRGVPFGEETCYVVPIGGGDSRRVNLLKGEGVFIDILDTDYSRDWQLAWQELLGRCIAYDRERRPADASAFADALERLVEQHSPQGTLPCAGHFGQPVAMEPYGGAAPASPFARLVVD